MFTRLLSRLSIALLLALTTAAGIASAQDQGNLKELVNALGAGSYDDTEVAVGALGATGDPAVAPILEILGEGDLYVRKSDGQVFIAEREGSDYRLTDPLTGEDAGIQSRTAVDKIRVNNNLRRVIRGALAGLTLRAPDPAVRLQAAGTMFDSPDPEMLPVLDEAIAAETDDGVRAAMGQARAAIVLSAPDAAPDDRIAAIGTISTRADQETLGLLRAVAANSDGEVEAAAEKAIGHVEQVLSMWAAIQNVWYGISLGSVLLLAAIGLAITFGVMGVINMAHGEMVMIGAYVTFVVQDLIRNHVPGLFDASVVIALPLAFLVAGAIGVAIERGIIRFLYGRPLETLLATWGLSLILQQAVRTIFGPTNRQVGAPSWMSGAFELGGLSITWNRLVIVLFALAVFALLVIALKRTSFGLRMRAVTQNRPMAGSMGIRTPWVDALTFGVGSGIAGIAGVALSQIDNVSPNLGQGYIIDSFMVVVFGGVGNLWGTLVGAMTLGVVNKFLEPYAGAVLAKILVLVFIILFIQKRPRGLFALKGRAVEA
ncbi:urea ABC transporter permease subunit UrtB [Microbaculum marinum]|uniref:Urea ABC transporter permease subunit UrtB n=1 Tax=Microbaculum marinum TaxID=1764581 RepID=A0AAW9RX44_9HYPH